MNGDLEYVDPYAMTYPVNPPLTNSRRQSRLSLMLTRHNSTTSSVKMRFATLLKCGKCSDACTNPNAGRNRPEPRPLHSKDQVPRDIFPEYLATKDDVSVATSASSDDSPFLRPIADLPEVPHTPVAGVVDIDPKLLARRHKSLDASAKDMQPFHELELAPTTNLVGHFSQLDLTPYGGSPARKKRPGETNFGMPDGINSSPISESVHQRSSTSSTASNTQSVAAPAPPNIATEPVMLRSQTMIYHEDVEDTSSQDTGSEEDNGSSPVGDVTFVRHNPDNRNSMVIWSPNDDETNPYARFAGNSTPQWRESLMGQSLASSVGGSSVGGSSVGGSSYQNFGGNASVPNGPSLEPIHSGAPFHPGGNDGINDGTNDNDNDGNKIQTQTGDSKNQISLNGTDDSDDDDGRNLDDSELDDDNDASALPPNATPNVMRIMSSDKWDSSHIAHAEAEMKIQMEILSMQESLRSPTGLGLGLETIPAATAGNVAGMNTNVSVGANIDGTGTERAFF